MELGVVADADVDPTVTVDVGRGRRRVDVVAVVGRVVAVAVAEDDEELADLTDRHVVGVAPAAGFDLGGGCVDERPDHGLAARVLVGVDRTAGGGHLEVAGGDDLVADEVGVPVVGRDRRDQVGRGQRRRVVGDGDDTTGQRTGEPVGVAGHGADDVAVERERRRAAERTQARDVGPVEVDGERTLVDVHAVDAEVDAEIVADRDVVGVARTTVGDGDRVLDEVADLDLEHGTAVVFTLLLDVETGGHDVDLGAVLRVGAVEVDGGVGSGDGQARERVARGTGARIDVAVEQRTGGVDERIVHPVDHLDPGGELGLDLDGERDPVHRVVGVRVVTEPPEDLCVVAVGRGAEIGAVELGLIGGEAAGAGTGDAGDVPAGGLRATFVAVGRLGRGELQAVGKGIHDEEVVGGQRVGRVDRVTRQGDVDVEVAGGTRRCLGGLVAGVGAGLRRGLLDTRALLDRHDGVLAVGLVELGVEVDVVVADLDGVELREDTVGRRHTVVGERDRDPCGAARLELTDLDLDEFGVTGEFGGAGGGGTVDEGVGGLADPDDGGLTREVLEGLRHRVGEYEATGGHLGGVGHPDGPGAAVGVGRVGAEVDGGATVDLGELLDLVLRLLEQERLVRHRLVGVALRVEAVTGVLPGEADLVQVVGRLDVGADLDGGVEGERLTGVERVVELPLAIGDLGDPGLRGQRTGEVAGADGRQVGGHDVVRGGGTRVGDRVGEEDLGADGRAVGVRGSGGRGLVDGEHRIGDRDVHAVRRVLGVGGAEVVLVGRDADLVRQRAGVGGLGVVGHRDRPLGGDRAGVGERERAGGSVDHAVAAGGAVDADTVDVDADGDVHVRDREVGRGTGADVGDHGGVGHGVARLVVPGNGRGVDGITVGGERRLVDLEDRPVVDHRVGGVDLTVEGGQAGGRGRHVAETVDGVPADLGVVRELVEELDGGAVGVLRVDLGGVGEDELAGIDRGRQRVRVPADHGAATGEGGRGELVDRIGAGGAGGQTRGRAVGEEGHAVGQDVGDGEVLVRGPAGQIDRDGVGDREIGAVALDVGFLADRRARRCDGDEGVVGVGGVDDRVVAATVAGQVGDECGSVVDDRGRRRRARHDLHLLGHGPGRATGEHVTGVVGHGPCGELPDTTTGGGPAVGHDDTVGVERLEGRGQGVGDDDVAGGGDGEGLGGRIEGRDRGGDLVLDGGAGLVGVVLRGGLQQLELGLDHGDGGDHPIGVTVRRAGRDRGEALRTLVDLAPHTRGRDLGEEGEHEDLTVGGHGVGGLTGTGLGGGLIGDVAGEEDLEDGLGAGGGGHQHEVVGVGFGAGREGLDHTVGIRIHRGARCDAQLHGVRVERQTVVEGGHLEPGRGIGRAVGAGQDVLEDLALVEGDELFEAHPLAGYTGGHTRLGEGVRRDRTRHTALECHVGRRRIVVREGGGGRRRHGRRQQHQCHQRSDPLPEARGGGQHRCAHSDSPQPRAHLAHRPSTDRHRGTSDERSAGYFPWIRGWK